LLCFVLALVFLAFAKVATASADDKEKPKPEVRVTGEVIHENEQVRMRVEDPKQIEIVENKG